MRDIVERELACGRNMAAKQLCRIGGLDVGTFFCAPRIFIAARHTCRMIKA